MIYKATRQITDNYFAHEGISQSQIRLFMKGFDYYQQNVGDQESERYFDEPKDHFIIGSAVDMMLTHEEIEFGDTYYISTLESKPSDSEISIIRMVFDKIVANNSGIISALDDPSMGNLISFDELMDHEQLLSESINEQGYRSNYGMPARMKYFATDICSQYWHELLQSGNKQIITATDKMLIDSLVETFRKSPATKRYFDTVNQSSLVDIIYQVPIYVESDNMCYKGLIDMVVLHHDTLEIILYDIKTMNDSTITFPSDYFKRKYDIQAAYYSALVGSSNVSFDFGSRYRKRTITYTLTDFRFLVASKQFPNSPTIEFSVGLENLNELIYGKPETSYVSIDTSGNFYSHKHKEVKSLMSVAKELHRSNASNKDTRLENNPSKIY